MVEVHDTWDIGYCIMEDTVLFIDRLGVGRHSVGCFNGATPGQRLRLTMTEPGRICLTMSSLQHSFGAWHQDKNKVPITTSASNASFDIERLDMRVWI